MPGTDTVERMKRWLGLLAILVIGTVVVLGYLRWQSQLPENRFMRIQRGMTIDEARAIMGNAEEGVPLVENHVIWHGQSLDTLCVTLDEDGRVVGKAILRGPNSSKPDYFDLPIGQKLTGMPQ
jgi:hypothetical protein